MLLPLPGYPTLPLTAAKIRSAKPKARSYKMYDARGLYLQINPCGSKLWRFKYKLGKREKGFSLGKYPYVSLSEARKLRETYRGQLLSGIDPASARKAHTASSEEDSRSFEEVAREWFAKKSPVWAISHSSKVIQRLERDIFPWLGRRQIAEIGPRELLGVLRKIESRGAIETAHRAKQNCSQIFRYGIAVGRCDRDPSADLTGALAPPKRRHHATIVDPVEVGALLRAIDGYVGSQVTRLALRLAPLVFVRPGELRAAEWNEINLVADEWRIPAAKMKMNSVHVVPLSIQAHAIIEELAKLTGSGRFVFPSIRSKRYCMSANTLNAALRRLGYSSEEMTTHGFRRMASTLLNELGWNRDAIERQLAHTERDAVRAAYNCAEYLPERRRMMQAWADCLDNLRNGTRKKRQMSPATLINENGSSRFSRSLAGQY